MRDLLVVIPSRGRPTQLATTLGALFGQSKSGTDAIVATDDDDLAHAEYERVITSVAGLSAGRLSWVTGARDTLTGWTNKLALSHLDGYRAFCSMGDDHVPVTEGWDKLLLDAIESLGGTGMVYPDDKRRDDVPECIVMSSEIIKALGWMMEPSLRHFWVDNVWADIGRETGLLKYCPEVVVEHRHYLTPGEPGRGVIRDATYAEAENLSNFSDVPVYEEWKRERMAGDVAKVTARLTAIHGA
jgi:hypothetical protein